MNSIITNTATGLLFTALLVLILPGCGENNSATGTKESENVLNEDAGDQDNNAGDLIVVITKDEVAVHNNQADCWVIVDDKVYDVTDAIADHPGGPQAIIPVCGTDATTVFTTRNKPEPSDHPEQAYENLNKLYIGDLGL